MNSELIWWKTILVEVKEFGKGLSAHSDVEVVVQDIL